jgi:hypothetical protein
MYVRVLRTLPSDPDAADAPYFDALRDAIEQHRPIRAADGSWQCQGNPEAHTAGSGNAPCSALFGLAVAQGVIA